MYLGFINLLIDFTLIGHKLYFLQVLLVMQGGEMAKL